MFAVDVVPQIQNLSAYIALAYGHYYARKSEITLAKISRYTVYPVHANMYTLTRLNNIGNTYRQHTAVSTQHLQNNTYTHVTGAS